MAHSRRFGRLACAALVLLPVAACSNDSKRPAAVSSSSASVAPLPTTLSSAPSSSSERCDAATPPSSAINVTTAEDDFNGDNETDTLTVYGTGTAAQPSPYHAQIELGGSKGAVDTVISDAATDNNQVVRALGGADITASAGLPPDGSGAEAFVLVGQGASSSLVGVFQLIGCSLTRLVGPQGTAPSAFAIGGSVTHLDGLRCDGSAGGQRLVQLSATSTDGITYATKETRLQVQNGQFSPLGAPIVNTLDGSDPALQAFSTLDCRRVQSP